MAFLPLEGSGQIAYTANVPNKRNVKLECKLADDLGALMFILRFNLTAGGVPVYINTIPEKVRINSLIRQLGVSLDGSSDFIDYEFIQQRFLHSIFRENDDIADTLPTGVVGATDYRYIGVLERLNVPVSNEKLWLNFEMSDIADMCSANLTGNNFELDIYAEYGMRDYGIDITRFSKSLVANTKLECDLEEDKALIAFIIDAYENNALDTWDMSLKQGKITEWESNTYTYQQRMKEHVHNLRDFLTDYENCFVVINDSIIPVRPSTKLSLKSNNARAMELTKIYRRG